MQQLVVISAKEDNTMPAGVFEARTFLLWGSSANHACSAQFSLIHIVPNHNSRPEALYTVRYKVERKPQQTEDTP